MEVKLPNNGLFPPVLVVLIFYLNVHILYGTLPHEKVSSGLGDIAFYLKSTERGKRSHTNL